ncbi:hypothetical protein BDM02DRAFT_3186216 [Thelephora ganbajun]|uniref:Uncharacterized protein n=1 Tax=Thelephora ganbajun TaxID=370292 RepID=A0ACB6ZJ76_THEGA|nr:hypothetical protein BDM02DRAFT_3186216 [Thelephora ganbajun]
MIIPDVALELSIEQLIGALNKKLFTEYTRVQSKLPPVSRNLVATLTIEIDALEKRAKDVLHEVITLRNSLRPVNRLPLEVIALCAAFVSRNDPRPIIPLTHVCRYWRKAIVFSPRNWASIGSGWKRLVSLCLERAAAAPLTISISISDIKGDGDFLQALLPHTSRISNLSLTGYSSIEGVTDDLPGFFASPIPNLTSVELEQTEKPTEWFPSNEAPAPPLFRNVSKLRSLHLVRTPLHPTVFSITSLVELKLVGYADPFHFGKFIEFLHSNPGLEVVILDLQFIEDSVWIAPERKTSLPQLRHLTFTCGSATDARGLLSCVSLRRGSHITIQGPQSDPRTDFASFLPCPPTSIRELLDPVTVIKLWSSPGLFHIFGGGGRLAFQGSKNTYDGFKLFVTGAVREFHTDVYRLDPSGDHLSWPLRRLPALEALVLSKTRFPPGSLSVLAEEPVLCPSLKTIAFFDCKVNEDVIRELEEVLAKRRDSTAARLYRVVIVNNTRALPDLQLIHQLRKFVPRVDVGVGDELPDLL